METEAQRGQWLISAHRSTGTRPHDSGAGPWRPEQHSYTLGKIRGRGQWFGQQRPCVFREHQPGRALAGRWVGRLVPEAWT